MRETIGFATRLFAAVLLLGFFPTPSGAQGEPVGPNNLED
jgi:hypothetical protein